MGQRTTKEKINNGLQITDSKFKITIRKIAHPFMLALAQTKIKYKLKKENKYTADKNKPIIFAVNHTNSQDIPLACTAIGRHSYLLIGKQNLEPMDEMFFNLNGAIYVDRMDKADKKHSKDAMVEYLKKNTSIIMFPEATWNLTDEKLMLPMRWGIIDIAKEANAQIVPLILDYDKKTKTCRAKFGKTISVSKDSDKKELIRDLRDEMASIRYEFFESNGTFKREEIDTLELREGIRSAVDEYPKLDYNYEQGTIFKPYTENEEAFALVKKITRF